MKRPALLLLGLLAATASSAQTVYRCGPEGREYQQAPCPGGQPLDVADARGEAQQREAAQLAQREAALAQQLRQASSAGTGVGSATTPPAPRPARAAPSPTDPKPAARPRGRHRHPLGPDERLARAPKADTAKPSKPPARADKTQP